MSQPLEDTIMKSVMELFKGDAVKFFGIDKKIVSGTTLSPEARNDLKEIEKYIAEDMGNPEAAKNTVNKIIKNTNICL